MKTALVIVHLSSLDSYSHMSYEAEGHFTHGQDLAQEISKAIIEHKGPVYIVDQGWDVGRPESEPRAELLKRISRRKGIIWITFDEAEDPWEPFLRKLLKMLRRDDVSRAIVGGVWYSKEAEEGCVTRVVAFLRQFMPVTVDPEIVGCESDFTWQGERS